ncbi:hypothetical protein IM792_19485 [Mucilaginibacter sp. JRF]|uniref:ATP-grasp fold amidoligase family protein n=1 Tax=Mucilaginibacter sp. JRF TaxID=2780088 RepID=UPI0018816210|nr:ATP-grasp fold amidoligase family protein [Mucilaginibacter sp. JRF]MBE9586641.1 hypothetical protein [Mucilaginibacter sp. JRF]
MLNISSKLPVLSGLSFTPSLFTNRIKRRHKAFWQSAGAEELRNTPIQNFASLDDLRSQPHWQRILSNKANASRFAAMYGCQTPTIYWQGRNVNDIDFNAIPAQFVIKPTVGHSCNNVFLINNGYNYMDKRYYTRRELLVEMEQTLAENPLTEILIEEFLTCEQGEYRIPVDYKLHAFNGEIARIEAIHRIGPREGTVNVYDKYWSPKENIGKKYVNALDATPPKCIAQIISQANVLSKAYQIYVRIDFYATSRGAVFGEFTPTPGIGVGFTKNADRLFTYYWDEYCKGMI